MGRKKALCQVPHWGPHRQGLEIVASKIFTVHTSTDHHYANRIAESKAPIWATHYLVDRLSVSRESQSFEATYYIRISPHPWSTNL